MCVCVSAYVCHIEYTRNVPFADVVVERRPVHEDFVQENQLCGVPVGNRAVGCRRRHRIGHPRRHGRFDILPVDGRLRSGMRREEEEQREAREAVRPPCDGPAAQEETRRVAIR